MTIQLRRLSHALGAEVTGVDITRSIDDATFGAIRSALLDHCLLLFRGQRLTHEQHVAVARRFGELDTYEAMPKVRHPEYPEILVKRRLPSKDASFSGEVWHSDGSYMRAPTTVTLLRGVEMPDVGGDTMFSNTYLAYDTLTEGMKTVVASLQGIHFGGKARMGRVMASQANGAEQNLPIAHPLVTVHPETGRKALFVNEKVKQIVGMNAEESQILLEYLCRHAGRPQFVYRHRWQNDDLLVWDNRCTNHKAVGDFDRTTQVRHVEKSTVLGTPTGLAYDGPIQYEGPRL